MTFGQTRELLDAPRVQRHIKLQWHTDSRKITLAIDDDETFLPIAGKPLLLAKPTAVLTYPKLNPLRTEVMAMRLDADEPRLVSIAGTLKTILTMAMFAGTTRPNVPSAIERWQSAIDAGYAQGRSGADAIREAIALIGGFIQQLSTELASHGDQAPPARSQLTALRHAVIELQQALRTQYVDASDRWQGVDYVFAPEVQPADKPHDVVVRARSIQFAADRESGAVVSLEEVDGSATFGIRPFERFTREFGVGTIVGSVSRPRYGTTRSVAGETVVARIGQDGVSVNPAFVVNFVCLCDTGPFVAPMVQFGVSTSKDVPALFAGGGVRLFRAGQGDISVGAGWMVGWVKDLRTLRLDDPVGGTRDIEADLGSKRRQGWYLVLQYKF